MKAIRIAIMLAILAALCGCSSFDYSKSGAWAPNGVNYTLSRDRKTGDQTDYFGVSWGLK